MSMVLKSMGKFWWSTAREQNRF